MIDLKPLTSAELSDLKAKAKDALPARTDLNNAIRSLIQPAAQKEDGK